MKLLRHAKVTAEIHCLTNIRIGGSKETFEIGGQDNPVIRNPITREPYIPGSSLKGKMRSLLELKGDLGEPAPNVEDGNPCGCGECLVCKLFGKNVTKGEGRKPQPTRLIFRDAHLNEEWKDRLAGESFVKFEVPIDRETGTVSGRGGLRNMEYVPAGAVFDFELTVRIFEGDPVDKFKNAIQQAIELLQNDYLGGCGSRGYGKVKFENLQFEGFEG